MKKTVITLLAAIALISAVVACEKNPDPGHDPGTDPDDKPDTPTAIITVDGKFSDWATAANVVIANLADESSAMYPNLQVLKAVADEEKVYLYFEYKLVEGQTSAPIDILVNSDNSPATGFASGIWTAEGWEYMLKSEAGFLGDDSIRSMDDITVYKLNGPDGADDWSIEDNVMTPQSLTSFFENAGEIVSGVAYCELSFLRSAVGATKKGALTLGMTTTNIVPWVDENGDPVLDGDGNMIYDDFTTGILPDFQTENVFSVNLP